MLTRCLPNSPAYRIVQNKLHAKFELKRAHGFDLEMYSEDGKGWTLAVSVNK